MKLVISNVILVHLLTIFAYVPSFAGEKLMQWMNQNNYKVTKYNSFTNASSVSIRPQDFVDILNEEKEIGPYCQIEKAWLEPIANSSLLEQTNTYLYKGGIGNYSIRVRLIKTIGDKKFYFTAALPTADFSPIVYTSEAKGKPSDLMAGSIFMSGSIDTHNGFLHNTGVWIKIDETKAKLAFAIFSGEYLGDFPRDEISHYTYLYCSQKK